MKKIDKLVIRDFIPPYIMAFFLAEFVLVMQFLWKYIDEIIGKGISLFVLLELIFYFAVRIIPEAIPVSILIASVMVFGNLAEKYEITSMKSSGISLMRIMWGGIAISILTAMFSLFTSNYLKPRVNYKFYSRYYAVKTQQPALSIEEGIFEDDFNNFRIRVGEKDPDGQGIHDVLIYDHEQRDKSRINLLVSEHGRMYSPSNVPYFVMELQDGVHYQELKSDKKSNEKSYEPLVRTEFKKWTKLFSTEDFEMEADGTSLKRKKHDLLNTFELIEAIDTFNSKISNRIDMVNPIWVNSDNASVIPKENKLNNIKGNVPDRISKIIDDKKNKKRKNTKKLSRVYQQVDSVSIDTVSSIIQLFNKNDYKMLYGGANGAINRNFENVKTQRRHIKDINYHKSVHVLRLNQMYSWALICIVFLFIGAPLGSIVRKGGYGYPLLIAIVFFMIFIILNIMGEKLNKSQSLDPVLAAWLPNMIMIPIAVITSYKALNDSDFSAYKWPFLLLYRSIVKLF